MKPFSPLALHVHSNKNCITETEWVACGSHSSLDRQSRCHRHQGHQLLWTLPVSRDLSHTTCRNNSRSGNKVDMPEATPACKPESRRNKTTR